MSSDPFNTPINQHLYLSVREILCRVDIEVFNPDNLCMA